MRFSYKIASAAATILLLAMLLLSVQQLSAVRYHSESFINLSVKELVKGVSYTLEAEMSAKKRMAESIAEIIQLAPNDRDLVQRIIERPGVKSSFLVAGLGYEEDGVLLENDEGWNQTADYDPRQRLWYVDVKNKNQLIITKPYLDENTGSIVISFGVPVQEKGKFIGGMFFDIDLGGLAALVNQTQLFDAGYLFLVTADGVTIAHPDAGKNGQKLADYLPNVRLEDKMQTVEIQGKTHAVSFTELPGEGWYIGAILDQETAFAELDSMRKSLLLYALFALILGVILLIALIRILIRPLKTLNNAIENVASGEGDLTQRLNTNTDKEFADLAKNFNIFTERLQCQIVDLKAISEKMIRGTEVTTAGALASVEVVRNQLQELEQLATAMNEMSATATEVANSAQGAADAMQEANEATQEGYSVVSQSTEAINSLSECIDQAVTEVEGLETAASNIETILKVINDIADQTNLLALNAAIEAARAGESGRGFAVVADEVRTLAQRTQDSTTEIRNMIEQLQLGATSVANAMNQSKNNATEAVESAGHANSSLLKIRDAIQRISDMNLHIASAAEEQSKVAEEINSNTLNIKDLSAQVAETAEKTNTAMQTQTEVIGEQDAILNRFIV